MKANYKHEILIIIGLVLALLLVCRSPANAATDVQLSWDYPHTGQGQTGFNLYRISGGNEPTEADWIALHGETIHLVVDGPDVRTCVDQDVPDGTYYYRLTAFDSAGNESVFSNVAAKTFDTTPPAPPENLTFLQRLVRWFVSWWG